MKKWLIILLVVVAFSFFAISGYIIISGKFNDNNGNSAPVAKNDPYTIELVESKGFSLRTEEYNNWNNLNVYITSDNKYSELYIEFTLYDEDGNIVFENNQWVAGVNAGDEVLSNFEVDASVVKSIIVKVRHSDYSDDLTFYDKSKVKININDVKSNGINVNLKLKNSATDSINFVAGYLLFYSDNKLVKVKDFLIENGICNMELEENFDYDSVKAFVNIVK